MLRSEKRSPSSGSLPKILYAFLISVRATDPAHLSFLLYLLFYAQLFSQRFVSRHTHSTFFPYDERQIFTPIQNKR
jgi:hypothetical protein